MAGDWIKMRIDLQSHPKVVRILSVTQSDKFRVIGGLHAMWSVFDVHSVDGLLPGYTLDMMDHVIGWPGFSHAVAAVGWLVEKDNQVLVMPEFIEHNGKSAKRRAEDQKRKRDARRSSDSPANAGEKSGQNADKSGTRGTEEEEKNSNNNTPEKWTDADMETAEAIFHLILDVAPSAKWQRKWPDVIRLMRERDGKTHSEIVGMMQWVSRDSFWRSNILSPTKLREQWVQLEAKRNRSNHSLPHPDGGSGDFGVGPGGEF